MLFLLLLFLLSYLLLNAFNCCNRNSSCRSDMIFSTSITSKYSSDGNDCCFAFIKEVEEGGGRGGRRVVVVVDGVFAILVVLGGAVVAVLVVVTVVVGAEIAILKDVLLPFVSFAIVEEEEYCDLVEEEEEDNDVDFGRLLW